VANDLFMVRLREKVNKAIVGGKGGVGKGESSRWGEW